MSRACSASHLVLIACSLGQLLLADIGLSRPSAGPAAELFWCGQSEVLLKDAPVYEIRTVFNDSRRVTKDMHCVFRTAPAYPGTRYYIELLEADVLPDRSFLQVLDGPDNSRLHFESNLHYSRQVSVSRTDQLVIKFTTEAYPTGSASDAGYRIRLTSFNTGSCPPNWHRLRSHCFSKSSAVFLGNASGVALPTPQMDYSTAQSVCNRMRANLLIATPEIRRDAGIGDLPQLAVRLELAVPVWIGLTHGEAADQFVWLDNTLESPVDHDWLCCRSGYAWSPGACPKTERFVLLRPTEAAFLVLEQPQSRHHFACYSPVNGTDAHYPIDPPGPLLGAQVDWPLLTGCAVALGLVCLLVGGALIVSSRWRGPRPPPPPLDVPVGPHNNNMSTRGSRETQPLITTDF